MTEPKGAAGSIKRAQIRYLFDHLRAEVLVSLSAAATVALNFGGILKLPGLGSWFSAMAGLASARLALWWFYRQRGAKESRSFWFAYNCLILLVGLTWSYTLVIVSTHGSELIYGIRIILLGVVVFSLYQFYFHPLTCFCFSFPIFCVSTGLFFVENTELGPLLGFLSVSFFIVLVFVSAISQVYTSEKLDLKSSVVEERDAAHFANSEKTRVIASASHDLRQPLHSLSLLHALLKEDNKDQSLDHTINNMGWAIDSLEKMLDILLDTAQLESGTLKPNLEAVNVSALVERLGGEFKPLAHQKGLALEVDLEPAWVESDVALLEIAIRNLTSNGINYTERGTVKLSVSKTAQDVLIAVRDTGVGIAEGNRGRIFEQYVQLSNPERNRNKGLGLGLANVRRVVSLLGIDIEVTSTLGEGSEFRLIIPKTDARQLSCANVDTCSDVASGNDKHVLVLEDDEIACRATVGYLEKLRYLITHCSDEEQLLKILQNSPRPPDVIITDYMLPKGFTGLEAVAAIRSRFGTDIPALVVTGDMREETKAKIIKANCTYLKKPTIPAHIRAFLFSATSGTLSKEETI